ncbi:ADP-ribose pyrophosphatase YjhB (NUDIX family) [Saonia flava]|uniref:ADP-ribose pyrophosphatase YjhB (NUDIX family) n=1 Tax=Saonia flava TaxID=523696 RepID=A0A846QT44_9FLAO|nr:NUDIX domain-containing protein [Saonia flava]NJB72136.1 ADP-ribose pyrophosphatase YjhB (NUDIX family) [Saonia flava]
MGINNYKNEDKLIVAVDCIIFGFDKEKLKVLLIQRAFEPEKGKWSLMGGFLKKNETLNEAAQRVLKNLTGLSDIYMEQLEAYSEVDRDPAERTISIAFSALINIEEHDKELQQQYSAQWFSIDSVPHLILDHDLMLERAMRRLRYKTTTQPVGFELLPEKFTMLQLQRLYEAILGKKLDKRNFVSKINSLKIVKRLEEKDRTSSKKGSFLYQFDEARYRKNLVSGFDLRF